MARLKAHLSEAWAMWLFIVLLLLEATCLAKR